jgi:hypothetical protein
MTVLVEVDGKRYKVVTKLYVVPVADSKGVKCFGPVKRISDAAAPATAPTATLSADWLRAAGFDDVAGDFSTVKRGQALRFPHEMRSPINELGWYKSKEGSA